MKMKWAVLILGGMMLTSCGGAGQITNSAVDGGTTSRVQSSKALSSSMISDEKLVALLRANGKETDYGWTWNATSLESGSQITRRIEYESKAGRRVIIAEFVYFTSSSGAEVYAQVDEYFTFGQYWSTVTLETEEIAVNNKACYFEYANTKFNMKGELTNFTYTVTNDNIGCTESQKDDYAKALAAYLVDAFDWAQNQLAKVNSSLI